MKLALLRSTSPQLYLLDPTEVNHAPIGSFGEQIDVYSLLVEKLGDILVEETETSSDVHLNTLSIAVDLDRLDHQLC